jgi:hypothetical protein
MAEVIHERSGGGIYALLTLIVELLVGAILYFGGFLGRRGAGSGDGPGEGTKKIEIDVGTKK